MMQPSHIPPMLVALLAGVVLLVGCPTYEDGLTGKYQQIEIDELKDEAIALDFYRFGDDARAVLRRYNIASAQARENPFDPNNEVSCQWTRVDKFDDRQRTFALTIPATARQPRVDLSGSFDEMGRMDLMVLEENQDEPSQLVLESDGSSPDPNCVNIGDFFLRAIFENSSDNTFDREVYELRHPVFALHWVGVEPVFRDGATIFLATNRTEPAFRLAPGAQFDTTNNGLRNSLSVSIPPPSERMLMNSGSTRFALAHFVVIDDAEGEGGFTWTVSEEPMVATALEQGRPDNVPEALAEEEIEGWGKALLFVEGRLNELSTNLKFRLDGLEEAEQDRHFYIVDVFFYNQEVESVRLPPRPEADRPVQRRVSLQMTEQYLEAGEVSLPRLYDYD